MEQLERIDIVLDLHNGAVERQGVEYQVLQGIIVYIVAEKRGGHVIGNVLELHRGHILEESLRKLVNLLGHVEPSIFGQSFNDGLTKVGHGGLVVGAVILHKNVVFACKVTKTWCNGKRIAPNFTLLNK